MEIERKWRINKDRFDLSKLEKKEILQKYISIDPVVVRIRKMDNNYFLTIKSKGSISREEFETEISKTQFEELEKQAIFNAIEKTRYYVILPDGHVGEMDVFGGKINGFSTIEVEFKTLDEANSFSVPDYFGEELTYDDKYKNNNLCKIM